MAKKYLDKSGLTYLIEQLDKRYQGGSGGGGFSATLLDHDDPCVPSDCETHTSVTQSTMQNYDWLIIVVAIGVGFNASSIVKKSDVVGNAVALGVGTGYVIAYMDGSVISLVNQNTTLYEYWIYGVNK